MRAFSLFHSSKALGKPDCFRAFRAPEKVGCGIHAFSRIAMGGGRELFIPTDKSTATVIETIKNGGQAIHLRLMFHKLAANRPAQKRPRTDKLSA